jgi:DNA-binding LacI/PurR family transcriptional regulator
VLREAIEAGEWSRWLPGELELARRLRVSRVTVRAALAILERGGLIRVSQGKRREILDSSRQAGAVEVRRAVVLLSPAPLHQLPAPTVVWMDELRAHLDAAGWPLEIHVGPAVYRRRPAHALEELATRLRPAAWILYRSTLEMQRWFSEHAPAAVIAGSRHASVPLAAVDVDHAACSRHAAARFLAEGHRRLAAVCPETELAGDLESISAFQKGAGMEVPCARHPATVRGLCAALERLFARTAAPTGLFVFHARNFLTVLGWLQRRGLQVPKDVSVICRDDEPFLEAVLPSPARYELRVSNFARKIFRLVLAMTQRSGGEPRQYRVMPTFRRGDSLGKAPPARQHVLQKYK